jgi:hypothetical protein
MEKNLERSISVKNCRRDKKIKLINYKGGKCEICGYDKIEFPGCFAFHHADPALKDFGISSKNCSLETAKNEVDKCLLLCCRCHAELHEKDRNLKRAVEIKLKKKYNSGIPKICEFCKKEFIWFKGVGRFCCRECFLNSNKMHNIDMYAILEEIKNDSISNVAKNHDINYDSLRAKISKFKKYLLKDVQNESEKKYNEP